MRRNSIIFAVLIGLTLTCLSCSKAASMSEDDKYRLYQAAVASNDDALLKEVEKKIGISDAKGEATDAVMPFVKGQLDWALKNEAFIVEHSDPRKAREYVKSHLPQ